MELLEQDFSIFKISPNLNLPEWILSSDIFFISKTPEELSIVCPTSKVSGDIKDIEQGWRILKVKGPLNFDLVGIISKISSTLAIAKISIFALSTFNTDYIALKEYCVSKAIFALEAVDIVVES